MQESLDSFLAAGPFTIITLVAMAATLAYSLTQKRQKIIPKDDGLQTNATRGSFVPLVIGRTRGGPLFAWVKDATSFVSGGAGGSTLFGKGGPKPPLQLTFSEEALHILSVGPGSRLIAIYENGERIWNGNATPQDTPSGSTFSVSQPDGNTTRISYFKLYWGFPDDPPMTSPNGVPTRFPHTFKVLWQNKELGTSRNWGRLEYEFECPCYSQIATSQSEVPLKHAFPMPYSEIEGWQPPALRCPGTVPYATRTGAVYLNICGYDGASSILVNWPDQYLEVDNVFPGSSAPVLVKYPVPLGRVKPGTIVGLYSSAGSTVYSEIPVAFRNPINGLLPVSSQVYYFKVLRASPGPDITILTSPPSAYTDDLATTELLLEPVTSEQEGLLISSLREGSLPAAGPVYSTAYQTSIGTLDYFSVAFGIGRCELAREDIASIGYNPVHIIDQLLFARFPYGAGKDRSEWDAQSIENAAAVMDRELIRGGVHLSDGEGLESVLAAIMQDIGMLTPPDPKTGLFSMRLLRAEEDVPVLPASICVSPPEMKNLAGERRADSIVFSFKDRENNYRQETIAESDTGEIARYQSQKSTTVPIEVTTDFASAQKIAKRRVQEALGDLTTVEFEMTHGSALAVPGDVFRAPDVEDPSSVFRVMEVEVDLNSPKTKVKAMLDAYTDVPTTVFSIVGEEGDLSPGTLRARESVAEDAVVLDDLHSYFAIELPRPLSGPKPSILIGAARGGGTIATAPVLISREGSAYEGAGYAMFVAAGRVSDPIPADGPCVDEGSYELFETSYGFDAMVQDLTMDMAGWRSGRQIMLVGNEIIYVRNPEDLGDGNAQVTGLLRGRLGTPVEEHAEGEMVYIFQSVDLAYIESLAFVPGKTIEYKVLAASLGKTSDLSAAAENSIEIRGLVYTPSKPTALRINGWRTTYSTAEDLWVRWNYHSNHYPRTGLGQQWLGQISGVSPIEGYFLVEILDDSDTLLQSFQLTENSLLLESADRAVLDLLPSWKIKVTQVEGSFSSDPAILEVFPA